MKKPVATSTEFYVALKELIPGLPPASKLASLSFKLLPGEPVVIELKVYTDIDPMITTTQRFNLTVRDE